MINKKILILCMFILCIATIAFADAGPMDAGPMDANALDANVIKSEMIVSNTNMAPTEDPVGAMNNLVQAVRDGNWSMVAACVLIVLVWFARKFNTKISFFQGDRGGPILVFALSFAGAISTSLMASEPISFKMFLAASQIALMAIGGFVGVKKILWPSD